jgi:hypothetical protein
MVRTITQKTKCKAKEKPKDSLPPATEERRELVSLIVGSYLTHSSSNVTCMQSVRFNNNRRSRTSISQARLQNINN